MQHAYKQMGDGRRATGDGRRRWAMGWCEGAAQRKLKGGNECVDAEMRCERGPSCAIVCSCVRVFMHSCVRASHGSERETSKQPIGQSAPPRESTRSHPMETHQTETDTTLSRRKKIQSTPPGPQKHTDGETGKTIKEQGDARGGGCCQRMPESLSAFCSIVSFTAANTNRMFDVSVACVKLRTQARPRVSSQLSPSRTLSPHPPSFGNTGTRGHGDTRWALTVDTRSAARGSPA